MTSTNDSNQLDRVDQSNAQVAHPMLANRKKLRDCYFLQALKQQE